MTITRWVLQTRLMNILPCTIANTNDLLTGRGGLVCVAELMRRIGFSAWVERYFPTPGSNRGYQPAAVVTCWMLMLHEGGALSGGRASSPGGQGVAQAAGVAAFAERGHAGGLAAAPGQRRGRYQGAGAGQPAAVGVGDG